MTFLTHREAAMIATREVKKNRKAPLHGHESDEKKNWSLTQRIGPWSSFSFYSNLKHGLIRIDPVN